jgi:lipopolysaccharide export system permease protein
LDTALVMRLEDFGTRAELTSTMTTPRLRKHIETTQAKGIPVAGLVLELLGRTSTPFAIYVMTLLGVSIAARKQRGGMGAHLFAAVLVGFSYVFTSKLITVYAASVALPEGFFLSQHGLLVVAAWLPNLLFALLGLLIHAKAPK